MKVTAVVITKDRPAQVQRLIDSIFRSEMPPLSLVLIDDGSRENFRDIEKALLPYRDICKHRSSIESQREVKGALEEIDLAQGQRSLLETCVGLRSPFLEFAQSLPRMTLFRDSLSSMLSQSFGPYSAARNLGIFIAYRAFDPDRIVFLDDDCYMENPQGVTAALHLIGKTLDGKEIVAVSGLYEGLRLHGRGERHIYGEPGPTSILTGMSSFLRRSFLADQEERLAVMPYHMLGGALILSEKVFSELPFDPFIPRGEDHAYCVDLKNLFGRDFAIVRDNRFIVEHARYLDEHPNLQETNTLRDIFRFVYLRFKIGHFFIPYFTTRWFLNAVLHMFLDTPKSRQRILELSALLFQARDYARRNAGKYPRIAETWESFLRRSS